MKPIKMLGLALVAALATMALLGAGSASATIALCKNKEEPCLTTNKYKFSTTEPLEIEAKQESQTAKLKDESFLGTTEIQCQKSIIVGKALKYSPNEQEIEGEITTAKWEECKRLNSLQEPKEQCTVEAVQAPWAFHLEQTTPYQGLLWTTPMSPTSGQPGAHIVCGITINATVKAKQTQTPPEQVKVAEQEIGGEVATENQPPTITMNQAPLKDGVSGQAFWTETYTVTKPLPLYLTQG